jgi:hypothetical protein
MPLQHMMGSAMSAVLHEDKRLDDLIDDWKALFPKVLANASTKKRNKVTR